MNERPTRSPDDLITAARAIVDANDYMTLATADADGRPWASPVWYAHEDYTVFLWISRPAALHSRNIAGRSHVGIVIFDSTVPPGQGRAVYVNATAQEITGDERQRSIAIYARRSVARGGGACHIDDVTAPAPLRLYKAMASEFYVLGGNDQRIPVDFARLAPTAPNEDPVARRGQ